ncbi:MAG: hypothetical protein OEY01_03165 [Desulfobulbaceae bacterium]|nr:hypothetical protein [Desulfobulbaceae bacterium]HIJ78291.1 hypothetical protein [Deltaproteobacteria bacterium]
MTSYSAMAFSPAPAGAAVLTVMPGNISVVRHSMVRIMARGDFFKGIFGLF